MLHLHNDQGMQSWL